MKINVSSQSLLIVLILLFLQACKTHQSLETEPLQPSNASLRKDDTDYESTARAFSGISSGLIVYYPFTGNAKDKSGNNNDATVYGAVLSKDRFGKLNRCYQFDGMNDYMLSTVRNIPLGKSPRTVSVWINPSAFPGDFSLTAFAWGVTSQSQANMLGLGRSGIISYQGWADDAPVTYNYSLNNWLHVVCVFDGVNASIYLNGSLLGTHQKPNWSTSSNSLFIGTRINADLGFFNGKIDELRIYNRVLSSQEIKLLFTLESLK